MEARTMFVPALCFALLQFVYGCGGSEADNNNVASTALSAPTSVSASASNGQVTLEWANVEGANSYNIYYLTYDGVTTTNSKQRTEAISGEPITGLTNETTYYFVVTSVGDAGESSPSSEVSAKPMPYLPGIPENISISGGVDEVTVTWHWVPDAVTYNIYYDTSPGVTASSPNSVKDIDLNTYTITGFDAAPQEHFYFVVTAVNTSGEGSHSVELVAVAKPTYKSVAAGYGHSAAVKIIEYELSVDSGSVWLWGDNSSGQLGTGGSPLESYTAIQVVGVNLVTDIANGWHHTVALRTDASVWDWGLNDYGQLGNLETTNTDLAYWAGGLEDMTAIAASEKHNIALKDDGTVWTWGFNEQGQLGYKSINCRVPLPLNQTLAWSCSFEPAQVTGITGLVSKIGVGFYHTLVVTDDGVVWGWGQNDSGQLGDIPPNCPADLQIAGNVGATGDEATICSTTPVEIVGIPGVAVAVTGGWGHTLALLDDGTVLSWGKNDYGQLGYEEGTSTLTCEQTSAFIFPCSITPTEVFGLTNITAIAAGWDHSIALKNDGTVWTWGRNAEGQLGNGEFSTEPVQAAVQVPDLTGVISIAAGAYHSLVVKDDGTVWAWGYNGHGQLGNGSTSSSSSPVQVQGLPDPIVIIPKI